LLGLGCSDFARHYFRNHGCFLFLWVLRWFTSPGSLRMAMYSPYGNPCSHGLGSPIRIFPDHRLLAPPRDFSQLATSFFAYLRQGIPTHALSSLTIKLTPYTESVLSFIYRHYLPQNPYDPAACLDAIASAPLPSSFYRERQVNLLHLHAIVHSHVMPVRYSIVKDRKYQTNRIPISDS
jgi:hypothetical protein